MICIKSKDDINALEITMASHPLIARFLKEYITSITSQYPDDELSDYGGFFFLESAEDVENHTAYHLSRPLKETPNEFSEVIIIQGKAEAKKVVHSVFIISNSFAVAVFAEDGLLDSATLQHLFEERIEDRTVTVAL
ncbi:hypothetical protein LJB90_03555 [Eubacteriales bacterium OttesenSCG-928-G02]|nr:hypothetical protein [Eubacteriales bacterium OttesenSCG-928-G02]